MITRLVLITIAVSVIFTPLYAFAEDNISTANNREERLTKAVAEQQIVLDDATKLTIQNRCITSQDILKGIQASSDLLVRKRLDLYSDIQKELQAIKLRMIKQGADASETDLLTGKLQQGLDNFTIQANSQGTALDDAIGTDCVQKPEQFRVALLILRVQRVKLLDSAANLKSIMNNSINSIFDQLKKRLVI
ncbi:MAG: hypothetical protein WCP03_00335 [Candidatus Saccharibacteria bacterium]